MKYTAILFCALFFCCKSPADKKILEDFKKVNESIDESNKEIIKSNYEANYRLIYAQLLEDPEMALHATNLYRMADSAIDYIEKMQEQLRQMDKTGNDLHVSTKLLASGPHGDTLRNVLWNAYQFAVVCPMSGNTMRNLNKEMSEIKAIPVSLDWNGAYFNEVPTSQAITMLELFKNDLLISSAAIMEDMVKKLKK